MPNRAQLGKIFGGAREAGLSKDQLYDVVESVSGGRSVSRLTPDQTREVLDALVRAGARPPTKPKARGTGQRRGRVAGPNEVLLMTGAQQEMIADLRAKLGGKWGEQRYFEGACMRLLRKPRPTTAGNAERVIEMLKQRANHAARKGART